ncbi:MAG: pantetheine-phosphate adenylyltransferase [Phycisphaeraceae bacterium]|nr:pantetheine-phosphate adenylyltransferase [Phycisphaeraceae bacterium]
MGSQGNIALFPGTFDPITNGHLDAIRRARPLFDQLIVAVGQNPGKAVLFSLEERVQMVREILMQEKIDAQVMPFEGLTVDFAKQVGACVFIRGLRNVTDLHYEFQLALTNRAIAGIETLFIMTGEAYGFTSSSLIKQIAAGGRVDRLHTLLPPLVLARMREKGLEQPGALKRLRDEGLGE